MKTFTKALGGVFLAATSATSLGLAWQAQQGLAPVPMTPTGGLRQVPPGSLAPGQLAAPSSDWRTALQSADFDARTAAVFEVLDALAGDPDLASSLEAWAADPSAPELAWTAHLILALAERAPAPKRPARPGASPFDGLLLDPFGSSFGGDPFRAFQNSPFGGNVRGQSHSMRITPGGVRIEVEVQDAQGTRTETYEADTLEELKADHPELFEGPGAPPLGGMRNVLGAPFERVFGAPPDPFGRVDDVRTDVLGVMIDPAFAQPGVQVQSVLPRTIAAAVGLAPGDTIVRINGRTITTRDDIAAELGERKAGAALEIEWVAPDGEHHTGTWTPEG